MDDVIQVIIFLFVIWSFLSSAFKKKPEPQKTQKRSSQNKSGQKQTMNYSTKDILEDLFGVPLPKNENENPSQRGRMHYPQDFEHEWNPEKENNSLDKLKSVEEREIKDIDFDKLSSLEVEGKIRRVKPNEPLVIESKLINERAKEIKRKIKDSATIRDAVLISEILNKPKALRN